MRTAKPSASATAQSRVSEATKTLTPDACFKCFADRQLDRVKGSKGVRQPVPHDEFLGQLHVVRLNHHDLEPAGFQIGEEPALQLLKFLRSYGTRSCLQSKDRADLHGGQLRDDALILRVLNKRIHPLCPNFDVIEFGDYAGVEEMSLQMRSLRSALKSSAREPGIFAIERRTCSSVMLSSA